ncbi:MAG: AraC family transcriptional regulator ligand-binding domain-containing protein [Myxococcales bacterium]|nr:AraC family transcriptional regulator ligand-binding domain-containing protein [Myxococcales bacterium]
MTHDGALLEQAAIDPSRMADPEVRFPEEQVLALMLLASSTRPGDPTFGVALASSIPLGRLELIDYLVAASPSIGDGVRALVRHARLCASGFTFEVQQGNLGEVPGQYVRMLHRAGTEALPPPLSEYMWALLIVRFREVCGPAFTPRLWLRSPATDTTQGREHYRAALGAVPARGECEAMFVPQVQWQLENPRRDPMLRRLLEAHAHDVAERLPGDSFTDTCRAAIADAIRLGDTAIEGVSRNLGLSARTLQRRLTACHESYQSLLDDVRRELALRYVTRSQLSLKEITDLLAYSEPSAFGRAFRRWTGVSPGEYRRRPPRRHPPFYATGTR